ncbi:hypothetical protein PHISCL_06164 [Aspergillus sclerotialis]|uniref:Uncharacterized protein n=1 Tax=Aspergillus sclerotialis TaxID=2070753 RepID=A0A3A2ZEB9_9EURO|nr:hypothetical protein PHISCL_06164 [Aspergillus sclerotialis]
MPADRTSIDVASKGYGVHLRWGQGVASRGRLTGQAVPVPKDAGLSENPFYLTLSAQEPISWVDSFTSQLLRHFDQGVATRLAWVDDIKNPWRNVILPLSHASPTVLHSLLALASNDLAYKYPTDHPWTHRLLAVSGHHRDTALSSLSSELADILGTSNPVSCAFQASCILASALILYNLELLTAPAAQWRIHLQCAREIIQWKIHATQHSHSADIADTFLLYEYYYTSVFIGLMTFDPTDDIPSDVPTCNSLTVFSDFIRIMHTVTRAERLKSANHLSSEIPRIEDILAENEAAKARMMQLGQTLVFKSAGARHDFEYLVYMYYHATLIYSHRVLSENTPPEECIRSSQIAILDHVLHLSQSASVAQDLVWPLFIAGSECRSIPHMQAIVERAMMNVMQISGSLDRHRVLSFLKTFWSMDLEPGTTWIQYARAKSISFSFLIII